LSNLGCRAHNVIPDVESFAGEDHDDQRSRTAALAAPIEPVPPRTKTRNGQLLSGSPPNAQAACDHNRRSLPANIAVQRGPSQIGRRKIASKQTLRKEIFPQFVLT
jgi:hypothetical protein